MLRERAYTVRGLLEKVTSYAAATAGDETGEVKFEYNDFGQPIADWQDHDDVVETGTPKVQYAYTDGSAGHTGVTGITYPNGRVLQQHYLGSHDPNLNRVTSNSGDGMTVTE